MKVLPHQNKRRAFIQRVFVSFFFFQLFALVNSTETQLLITSTFIRKLWGKTYTPLVPVVWEFTCGRRYLGICFKGFLKWTFCTSLMVAAFSVCTGLRLSWLNREDKRWDTLLGKSQVTRREVKIQSMLSHDLHRKSIQFEIMSHYFWMNLRLSPLTVFFFTSTAAENRRI